MALVNIREVYPGVSLGIWEINESVEEMVEHYSWTESLSMEMERFKSEGRKKEFLAVRVLLHEMLLLFGASESRAYDLGRISYNSGGKPLLKGYHISISHTQGYAAVILSKKHEVAVDVEYFSDRVEKVKSKFLRKDEKAEGLDSLLVHWCGKETVYKLFSEENLQFGEMRVCPFDTMGDWFCKIENLKSKKTVTVDFELTMDFVLTYAAL